MANRYGAMSKAVDATVVAVVAVDAIVVAAIAVLLYFILLAPPTDLPPRVHECWTGPPAGHTLP
jgi:hypothetical protein